MDWNSLNEEDKENYDKVLAIIKDKIIKQPVLNANKFKPSDVIKEVENRTNVRINLNNHTDLWKAFQVRPRGNSKSKFATNTKYCIYDEPHNDYLYTEEWVDFITSLITDFGFKKDNIHNKCKEKMDINAFMK